MAVCDNCKDTDAREATIEAQFVWDPGESNAQTVDWGLCEVCFEKLRELEQLGVTKFNSATRGGEKLV